MAATQVTLPLPHWKSRRNVLLHDVCVLKCYCTSPTPSTPPTPVVSCKMIPTFPCHSFCIQESLRKPILRDLAGHSLNSSKVDIPVSSNRFGTQKTLRLQHSLLSLSAHFQSQRNVLLHPFCCLTRSIALSLVSVATGGASRNSCHLSLSFILPTGVSA